MMLKVSANRLKIFIECRNKFYLKYILGVEEPKNIYAIRGMAVHRAIEMFYKEGANPFQTYEETWNKEIKEHNIEHSNKLFYEGDAILEIYDWAPMAADTETYFCLPFPDRENPIVLIEGYIDLMYDDVLVDIKTAKYKPTQAQIAKDLQFIIYSWAAKELYPEKEMRVYWYHARDAEYIPVVGAEQSIHLVTDSIQKLEQFLQNPILETKTQVCRYCLNPEMCRQLI